MKGVLDPGYFARSRIVVGRMRQGLSSGGEDTRELQGVCHIGSLKQGLVDL